MWDAATGRLRREVRSGYDGIGLYARAPGGRPFVVEALPSGETARAALRAWDVSTGQERCRLGPWDAEDVRDSALSPDGSCLAVAGKGGACHLWDMATGKKRLDVAAPDCDVVVHVAFSTDGRRLAVSHRGGPIRVLDSRTGTEVRRLGGKVEGWFPHTAVSPDGTRLAELVHMKWPGTNDFSHALRIWDLATGRKGLCWDVDVNFHPVLAFSPDGRLLACNDFFTGVVFLLDAATGMEFRRFAGHAGSVSALAFSPDSRTLASGGGDTTVFLWDVSDLMKR
jgi:WD40 repeat protein